MLSNIVHSISIDADNTKWISVNGGVSAYNEEWVNYINDEIIFPSYNTLNQNYPNPFNPETTISYQLPKNSEVELSIYNIKGQKVKTLVHEVLPAGEHAIIWDGRNSNGNRVSSGIYFYKLEAGDYQKVKKMILLR